MLPVHKASGQFIRKLGTGKDQKPFYLGKDHRSAAVRVARLEAVWELVKPTGWTEATLTIAKAVARGDERVKLPPPPPEATDGEALVDWSTAHAERYATIIKVLPHDADRLEVAVGSPKLI
jgi:hypothetical protein